MSNIKPSEKYTQEIAKHAKPVRYLFVHPLSQFSKDLDKRFRKLGLRNALLDFKNYEETVISVKYKGNKKNHILIPCELSNVDDYDNPAVKDKLEADAKQCVRFFEEKLSQAEQKEILQKLEDGKITSSDVD